MRMCPIKIEKNLRRSNIKQDYDDEMQTINVCLVQVSFHAPRILLVLLLQMSEHPLINECVVLRSKKGCPSNTA